MPEAVCKRWREYAGGHDDGSTWTLHLTKDDVPAYVRAMNGNRDKDSFTYFSIEPSEEPLYLCEVDDDTYEQLKAAVTAHGISIASAPKRIKYIH